MHRFRIIGLIALSTHATLAIAVPTHALAGHNQKETFVRESTD